MVTAESHGSACWVLISNIPILWEEHKIEETILG